jgi:hypothetical protein
MLYLMLVNTFFWQYSLREAKFSFLNIKVLAQSIEWFIEDQAFFRPYDSATRPRHSTPLPSASFLSFSVFLCVADRAYCRERGIGWARSHIKRPRESLPYINSSILSWGVVFGLPGSGSGSSSTRYGSGSGSGSVAVYLLNLSNARIPLSLYLCN